MQQTKERGFTLIELVIVIVILGILAAVAIPRFVDLRQDAKRAAAQGIAGALSSASVINYAAVAAGATTNTTAVSSTGSCAALANNLLQGGTAQYAATWSFSNTYSCPGAGGTVACSVTSSAAPAVSASATIICTG